MHFAKKTKQKGFSIIELLLVVVFMTAIISGVIPLFTNAIAANKNNRNKLLSYQAANAEIENMRNSSFDTLADHSFSVQGVNQASGAVSLSSQIDGQIQTEILEVTVTVTWPYKNKTEEVKLITYIAKDGINK